MSNGQAALAEAGSGMDRQRMELVHGFGELGVRSADGRKRKTLHGVMVPFDEWIEVGPNGEGHFMEQFVPGSVDKSFRERADRIRAICHHGKELLLGTMPLGKIVDLHADQRAAYYEVELFDSVPALLIEGIEAGQYGTSMKFEVMRHDPTYRPGKSAHNPLGLNEVRVLEAKVIEFGPTPFNAYDGATAHLRSLDDAQGYRPLVERSAQTTEDRGTARRYERAISKVAASAWAIHPAWLATIIGIIGERSQGYRPTAEEITERIGERAASEDPAPTDGPVQVIRIRGSIVPHAGMFADVSEEGRAIEDIRNEFREAVASEDVKAILLDVDSPGGTVDLVPELATEIREARAAKPVWALANTMAASAAYYLASQADQVIVTPSGEVGSIGVYAAHTDISELQAKAGIKTTLVSAGKFKVEGNPFEPLSEEAEAELQEQIDTLYKMFVRDVAKGRGVAVKQVESDFGQGRMVLAEKAVERGMADAVATFDQTLARLEELAAKAGPTERAAAPDDREPERTDASTPEPSRRSTRSPSRNYLREEEPTWRL